MLKLTAAKLSQPRTTSWGPFLLFPLLASTIAILVLTIRQACDINDVTILGNTIAGTFPTLFVEPDGVTRDRLSVSTYNIGFAVMMFLIPCMEMIHLPVHILLSLRRAMPPLASVALSVFFALGWIVTLVIERCNAEAAYKYNSKAIINMTLAGLNVGLYLGYLGLVYKALRDTRSERDIEADSEGVTALKVDG